MAFYAIFKTFLCSKNKHRSPDNKFNLLNGSTGISHTYLGFYSLANLLPDREQQQKEHTHFTILQKDFYVFNSFTHKALWSCCPFVMC